MQSQQQSIPSSRTVSPLSNYLKEIGRTPLLTAEEERSLGERVQQGDAFARQYMTLANLRLVVNIAKQYVPGNEPELILDLIQEGNIGLMRAVDRFKPDFGTRFSTYGVYWIRQAILRALKARRLVRLPENVFDRVLLMQRTKAKLSQILGRTPSSKEVAAEMEAKPDEVAELEAFSSDIVSLERNVNVGNDEDQARLQDVIEDDESPSPIQVAHESLNREEMHNAVHGLPVREREIIDARFGLSGNPPMTLEEIGEGFGISRERVRQLQNVALERLRHRRKVTRMV
jgi:RNA polymerase primary sigma factor